MPTPLRYPGAIRVVRADTPDIARRAWVRAPTPRSSRLKPGECHLFTWRDRRPHAGTAPIVLVRWAAYQGSVAGTALLNMLVFVAVRAVLPPLVASAAGLAAAASGNFVIGDRFVFR
jgi:hypothetical protein